MKKKKRKTITITLAELTKDWEKYLELSKDINIDVVNEGRLVLGYNEISYRKYKAFKRIRELFPNGLKIDPSDIR